MTWGEENDDHQSLPYDYPDDPPEMPDLPDDGIVLGNPPF